jgi:hypothetical protein
VQRDSPEQTTHCEQQGIMKTKLALNPKHPERICWGCEKYCSADDLRCGNGTIRTQHPIELFGEDWRDWELNNDGVPHPSASTEDGDLSRP